MSRDHYFSILMYLDRQTIFSQYLPNLDKILCQVKTMLEHDLNLTFPTPFLQARITFISVAYLLGSHNKLIFLVHCLTNY
jgi:hypothetical protein